MGKLAKRKRKVGFLRNDEEEEEEEESTANHEAGSTTKGCPPQSAKDACENILVAIQKCSLSSSSSSSSKSSSSQEGMMVINLDHILSKVPYKDMLKDLFGSSSGATIPQIPVVTKAYEESFMRQPMFEHEKPCIMGSECECNMISSVPGEGFVGVEFHLPSSHAGGDTKVQMCVLCHRKMVQKLFYDIIYADSPYRSVPRFLFFLDTKFLALTIWVKQGDHPEVWQHMQPRE
jgi:hypothetical protein